MPRIRIEWEVDDAVLKGLHQRLQQGGPIELTEVEKEVLKKIISRYVEADVIRQRQAAHEAKPSCGSGDYPGRAYGGGF